MKPFSESQTSDQPFHYAGGRTADIPFMSRDDRHLYHTTRRYKALDKPFKDSTFSLTVIRPGKGSVKSFIRNLDAELLGTLYDSLDYGRAIVNLPKMKLDYKQELSPNLINMGIEKPFDKSRANFDNLGRSLRGANLFISRVNHKSVLEIDEKGAEGAAVTSVGVSFTSLPPQLTFDEPYVVILRHIETNSLLFIGRVMQPSWN